jgi:hypothetical protein
MRTRGSQAGAAQSPQAIMGQQSCLTGFETLAGHNRIGVVGSFRRCEQAESYFRRRLGYTLELGNQIPGIDVGTLIPKTARKNP